MGSVVTAVGRFTTALVPVLNRNGDKNRRSSHRGACIYLFLLALGPSLPRENSCPAKNPLSIVITASRS